MGDDCPYVNVHMYSNIQAFLFIVSILGTHLDYIKGTCIMQYVDVSFAINP